VGEHGEAGHASGGQEDQVREVLRPAPGKYVVEVHDYHDAETGVLRSSLRKRAPGYVSLGFPDPRTG
jgi:hypothetical protein